MNMHAPKPKLVLPEPGVYFGMDEAEYHAIPALSNSGIKWLLVSPMDFWARSWMNPDREEPEDTVFTEMGSAYHARILEGREAFYSRYAPALDPEDYPDALRTADEIKAALADADPKAKKAGTKADLIERLLAIRPEAIVWDTLLREHAERHEGKTLLSPALIRKIEISAAMIEKHPTLSKAFQGGQPEVTIIWNCRETGAPMKARIDYLKIRSIVDLKTLSNPLGKPFDRAVTSSMASGKYHIQAAIYCEAVAEARRMIRESDLCVHGVVDTDWLKKFAASDDCEFAFVFQQTGVAPVARAYKFPKSLVFDCGRIASREARRQFMEYRERFGDDIWLDFSDIHTFEDTDFPAYITE
jgi:hypothetical protein